MVDETMIAIIGGTGLTSAQSFAFEAQKEMSNEYGKPSAPVLLGEMAGKQVVFLARHGFEHQIPPHRVNYRANIQALHSLGVSHIVAVNAVGGISDKMSTGSLVVPDQIIDYTYGREQSFFSDDGQPVVHIDFSWPFSGTLRENILIAARNLRLPIRNRAVYGCTQGPRLETAAEIQRLARDGCDIVGMTLMPEAALARELNIPYASVSFVANWAAGLTDAPLSMQEIEHQINQSMVDIKELLEEIVAVSS